jgi:hypothetical protein
MDESIKRDKRDTYMKIWLFLLIIAIWFALQIYILPKLGIST